MIWSRQRLLLEGRSASSEPIDLASKPLEPGKVIADGIPIAHTDTSQAWWRAAATSLNVPMAM
jgi:hypothetical protein